MKSMRTILTIILFLTYSVLPVLESGAAGNYVLAFQTRRIPARSVFREIEEGIAEGKVDKFSSYFNRQTYLSLSNGARGYFSSNQAFYVLQDYFKINRTSSFRFVTIYEEGDTPYATGIYTHEQRGRKIYKQVFISLTVQSNSWKITQITFN